MCDVNRTKLYDKEFWALKGWSGVAKVSCILRHRGVQLILGCNLARPAILVAGKGRGGMFLLSPAFSKKSGGTLFRLCVVRGAWRVVRGSEFLVGTMSP